MATEHRYGHTFYAGLASPGPAADYMLTSCFASADGYARHQGAKQRTKYFELWITYIRKAFRMLAISLHLVTTDTEVADALTKALPRGSLIKFRNYMMNAS